MRQALGHAAGGHSCFCFDSGAGFLIQGFGAVTVAGLHMELGHQHLSPDGSQLPGKKIEAWARGAMCTDSDKYMTLNKLGPFSAGLAHL